MSSLAARSRASGSLTCLACTLIVLSGCATWTVPIDTGDTPLRSRAVTEAKPGVRVSAAVLGPEDCVRMLGRDVTADGVQPVWIEVTNDTESVLWLLRSGADPDYFSPLEVAWSAHGSAVAPNQCADRRALQPACVPQSDSGAWHEQRNPVYQPPARNKAAYCRSAWQQDDDSLHAVSAGARRHGGRQGGGSSIPRHGNRQLRGSRCAAPCARRFALLRNDDRRPRRRADQCRADRTSR